MLSGGTLVAVLHADRLRRVAVVCLLPSTASLDAWSLLDQPALLGHNCPRVTLDAILPKEIS